MVARAGKRRSRESACLKKVSVGEEEKVLGGDSSEGSTLPGRYSVPLRHNGVD